MNQDVPFTLLPSFQVVDHSVKKTLNILVLTVLQEKSQIAKSSTLEPVLAIVTSTINNCLDIVLLQALPRLSHLLTRNKDTIHDLATLILEFVHFEFVPGGGPDVEFDLTIHLLLLNYLIARLLERLQVEVEDRRFYPSPYT